MLADQIRAAYDDSDLRTITKIREQLEHDCELADARSRLLLGKLKPLELAELPSWFKAPPEAKGVSIYMAEQLVCAVAKVLPELKATVDVWQLGRVSIDWRVPSGHCWWVIEAMDVPWPCVKVYQLSSQEKSRIFFNAYDALESLKEFMNVA